MGFVIIGSGDVWFYKGIRYSSFRAALEAAWKDRKTRWQAERGRGNPPPSGKQHSSPKSISHRRRRSQPQDIPNGKKDRPQ